MAFRESRALLSSVLELILMNAQLKLRKQETMAKKGGSIGAGILVVLIIAPFVFLFKFAQENPLPTGLLLSLLVGR